jgi:DNA-binding MarR family transcriptional regulator
MGKKREQCPDEYASSVVIHPALKEYFTYRFYKLALRLRAHVNEALEKQDLLGIQLGLLRVLEVEGPSSQVAFGRSMGVDKATMVKLLDDLERKGLIQRIAVKDDRRIKHIRITSQGSRTLREGTKIREQVEQRFFAVLTKEERDSLDRALTKLVG